MPSLVVLGVAVGLLAATPVLYALHRAARGDKACMAYGLGGILASFFGIQLATCAVHLTEPAATLPFGGGAACSFLVAVTVSGLVAWSRAQRR